jgi:glyceraldehyde 3-phosphate dehydrogenase
MAIKVAINGFGRIGRPTFREILNKHPGIEVVAINDLADAKTLAYLLKYDSLYGIFKKQIKARDNELLVDGKDNGKKVKVFAESDPEKLPWKKLNIDIVLECTGHFTDLDGANKHLKAGAKKVIISAPSDHQDEIPTYLLGVNQEKYNSKKDDIISMGSCTTNCLAPVAKVLDQELGIVKGFMTTIHSYTNDQRILDLAHKDLRRSRAAGMNIIPTTTGAAKTVEKCLPQLKGKLDGLALRVPTPVVSIVDFVCQVEKSTSAEEVNYILKKNSEKEGLRGILGIEDAPLVSSDYRGNSYSAVIDALSTMVQENLVKVLVWYDNEYGYACRLAELAEYIGNKI